MVDSVRKICLPTETSSRGGGVRALFSRCWPQDAEELFRQGGQLFAEGKPDAAIAAFQRAVALRPDYAQAWKALGVVYASRQEFDRAETPFRNACERQPSLPDACLYYGRTLYLLNRFQPAIDVLHPVLQRDAENSEAYRLLALSLEALGQAAEAGECLPPVSALLSRLRCE